MLAINDPVGFLQSHETGIILDEVQNVPELLSCIQGLVDEKRERKFILSGSSNFALLKNISQSLAGRTAVFELLQLSYNEVSNLALLKSIDEILFDGLYPAIYSGEKTPVFLYPNYVKSNLYFYRDSNQNEVDLVLRTGNNFDVTEIKSSMTYNSDFEKGINYFSGIFRDRVISKQIIYCGELENPAGNIKLFNYRELLKN